MYDTHLLVLFGSKDKYERFMPYVKEKTVSPATYEVIKVIEEYYKNYPSITEISWQDLSSFYMMVKGKGKPEKLKEVANVLKSVEELSSEIKTNPSKAPVHEDVINHYVKLDYATKIASKALNVVNHQYTSGESEELNLIGELVDEYERETKKAVDKGSVFIAPSVSTLAKSVLAGGFNWPLHELNISLGPLRLGDFVIVGARPETGKTTFGVQCATHFAKNILVTPSNPVIYIGNEESASRILFRCYQSAFGATAEEIAKNSTHYDALWKKEIGDKLLIVDDAANLTNVAQYKKLFREYNPSCIFFDQLDNVIGFTGEDKEHMRIGKLYRWARELAKEYGPVIAMSQIEGSGEGQEWLTMAQLRESKTDKPATADAIITIGKSNNKAKEYCRFIHLPKNKLMGLPGVTEEGYRHAYFEVTIDPSKGRYISTMRK